MEWASVAIWHICMYWNSVVALQKGLGPAAGPWPSRWAFALYKGPALAANVGRCRRANVVTNARKGSAEDFWFHRRPNQCSRLGPFGRAWPFGQRHSF